MLCCAVLCCVVLRCAALHCAVLRCALQDTHWRFHAMVQYDHLGQQVFFHRTVSTQWALDLPHITLHVSCGRVLCSACEAAATQAAGTQWPLDGCKWTLLQWLMAVSRCGLVFAAV